MIKILHAADLHLDSPLVRDPALRTALLALPGKLAQICAREGCDLVLLAGDLFDGPYTRESFLSLSRALGDMGVPVFISPGNHDFSGPESPYSQEIWPDNVHIFNHTVISAVTLADLDCRVYGAGFQSMDCEALLAGFRAEGTERHHIAVLHGDPTQVSSPYDPITKAQVRDSALDYLALGHIHATGSFRAGSTLCAWPGCPMGRGFDEPGEKGVLLVTLDEEVQAQFLPLEGPRFHEFKAQIREDPAGTLEALLPPVGNEDYYRVTLTGEWPGLDLPGLRGQFARFPHLELRDETVPPVDLWASAGEDTLEGAYFGLLRDALATADEDQADRIRLAARLSRKILDGQEVVLP